jgi:murein DD-endopeptidase MepM/ murein hydrolase activator NlpD
MRKKYIKRKTVVTLITLVLMVMAAPIMNVFGTATTREQVRQEELRLQGIRRNVRDQQNLLQGTRHEMSQLVQEMQELDQQMMDAAEALESIEYSLYVTGNRRELYEAALEAAHEEADRYMALLHSRLRMMHEQGNIGMLDVLFRAENIFDFLIRWDDIRAITQFDREMFANIEANEARINTSINDLARATNLMEELLIQEQFALMELEFRLEERQAFFLRLEEDEAAMAELLDIFEEEQRAAESTFANLQARLQREQADMARAAANARQSQQIAALASFNGEFEWPLPGHTMSNNPGARFGMRIHPISRQYRMHTGIDVAARIGTPIVAAQEGYVRFVGWSGGYGLTVIIDHADGYSTLYAHNSRNRVTAGQRVYRGQHIADIGSTGASTGPHLHFEVRVNNRAVDPLRYFPGIF